jgi:KipI family sensor histidine kinase inhibitor
MHLWQLKNDHAVWCYKSSMPDDLIIAPCGDAALTVEFGRVVDAGINARVRALDEVMTQEPPLGVRETMPSYGSLLVHYDPHTIRFVPLADRIRALVARLTIAPARQTGWCVPVAYGGSLGFDLEAVATSLDLCPEEIIRRHVHARYQVFMVGFLPGFTYLGGLDQTIAVPRRPVPRLCVPAGSIVIGGVQTAIGSIEGPSGWHVIGRTPVRAFAPQRDPAVFMMPGDRIVLEAISHDVFEVLTARAERGLLVAEPLL